MVKSLDSLPGDIHRLLDGADLTASIGRFKDDIATMMLGRFSEEKRPGTLRMSNIGKPNRQLWYEINAEKANIKAEEISGKTKFKFLYGHLLESLVLYLAEEAGYEVERLQEEVQVDGIVGHIDAVINGVLCDVKSCSSFSFNKFKYGTVFKDDPFGYRMQIAGYAHALGLPAAWIAVDKVTGEIAVCHVPQEFIDQYDVRTRIKEVRAAVAMDVEPARCYEPVPHNKSGNKKLPIGCSYCPYKMECWKDSNGGKGLQLYDYSTGIIYLTEIVKEPKVPQQKDWYEFEPAEKLINE